MKYLKNTILIVLLVVVGLTTPALAEMVTKDEVLNADRQARTKQESRVVIYQSFPEFMPMETGAARETQPTPISLALKEAFHKARNVRELSPVSSEEIATADKEAEERRGDIRPGPRRVGVVRKVAPTPLSVNGKTAVQLDLPDGKKMWTLAVRSPEAYGMRIHFSNFDVGDGLVLVYAQDGEQLIVRGPYRGKGPNSKGDFWTASLPGDTVFLEITGTEDPAFEIGEIVHFDQDFTCADCQGDITPLVLDCHLDVMCDGDLPVDAICRDATGQMNYNSGGKAYVCTGTLLNDLDDETWVPYFLTAYHCLHTQSEVDTLEVVWLWQRPSCGGTLPNYFTLPRSNRGMLFATNSTDGGNDMTFIRLGGSAPGGVGFAGWTTGHPSTGYGIHHPAGDWKRATFLSGAGLLRPRCMDTDYYDHLDMDSGIVEGGSSGSGLFNSVGQLAGQLFGTCGPDEDLDCGNVGDFTAAYGEFEETYPLISYYLRIGGTIYVDWRNDNPFPTGTPNNPFPTVTEAHSRAWHDLRIKIRDGSYPESVTFSKRLQLLANGGTVNIGTTGRMSLTTSGTIKIYSGGSLRVY